MDETFLINTGALGIVFLFTIREFFLYLKAKKSNGNGIKDLLNKDLLSEVKLLNSNHLHSIQNAINDGNEKIVQAINENGRILSQMLGKLNK